MKFENLTMEDEAYCPVCGSGDTISDEYWLDKEFRVCNSCKSMYVINYKRVVEEVYVQE